MKSKNKITVTISLVLITLFSCSSDSETPSNNTNSIIGKWYIYKNIEAGRTNIGKDICSEFPNCKTYEFKSNGTCIFTEYGYVTATNYKVDGDFVKHYDPKTEDLIQTDRIILLNNEELGLDQTDEINYFKKM